MRRWWRTRALRDLQAAFVVAVMVATVVAVAWVQVRQYPGDGFLAFLGRAPGTVATLVTPALLCVAFWLWLLRGSHESAPAAVHRFLIQPIARSPVALVAGTLVAAIGAAGGIAGIVAARAALNRPPVVGAGKVLVVVFSRNLSGLAGPSHFGEDAVREIRDLDEHIQFETPSIPFSDQLIAAWNEDGVRPFLIVTSEYDGFQLRVSFRISQSEFSLKMDSPDTASNSGFALSFLPIRLDRVDPQRLALSPSTDANLLLSDYPQQVQSTIRLILGIQALAESRLSPALAWLEPPVYRWDQDRPGDESLRAALRAVALRRTRNSSALGEILQSVIAFKRRRDRTEDLVATGDLAKRLPRLVAVAHTYVTSPLLLNALQRAGGFQMKSPAAFPAIFRQAYGENWIPIMRFGEMYQFYAYDEFFRALPPDEKSAFEHDITESLKTLQSSRASVEPFCQGVALPDGSTYRLMDGVGFLARDWWQCPDCDKPQWFIESLMQLWSLCEARNR